MLLVVVFVAVLAGCATNPATSALKAGMRSTQIEARVDSKQGMRYGVDLAGGGLANALASMIVDSAGQKGVTRMSEVMQKHEIVVSEIVRECVAKRLKQNGQLQIVEAEADGVFVVRIMQYGFDSPGLQLSRKVPIILLGAELRARNGKKVWSGQNAAIQLASKNMGATWEEYEAQPEKLRADWIKQIETVVAALFSSK